MSEVFTTLDSVKNWRSPSITTTTDDDEISRVIVASSRFILNNLQRPSLLSKSYSEIRDGYGGNTLVLRQWPATSIQAVSSFGQVIPAATSFNASGYLFDVWDGVSAGAQQRLVARGYGLARGPASISLSYTAGYLVVAEAQVVPAAPYQVTTDRFWAADSGVTYASGAALVAVTGSPTMGQYVAPTTVGAPYQFSAADAGADVLISYSYVPDDIQQACIELVILRVNERNRIGTVSHGMKGETTSYFQKFITGSVDMALQPYRRIFPV
jgi:hypothetical protein